MAAPDDGVRRAIDALIAEAGRDLARHPLGHLVHGRKLRLQLPLTVPLNSGDEAVETAIAEARRALDQELAEALTHHAAFRPGCVWCLRCAAIDCEHSAPPDNRHVFAGYGPSGLPEWIDFAQWLLERRHPQMDQIYRTPPGLVTQVVAAEEIKQKLLPPFRQSDVHLHGQVTAGWYSIPPASPGAPLDVLALSFLIVSTPGRGKRRRLGLTVLGRGPGGEPLEHLYQRLRTVPWAKAVQWAQPALDSIERAQRRPQKSKKSEQGGDGDKETKKPARMKERIAGLLQGIERRLHQDQRGRRRRTSHAQDRHVSGERPTRLALSDLSRAPKDAFFVDTRKKTRIVVGERGRAHIFNEEGRLVTSVRYSPESIERKQEREIWRRAKKDEIADLRRNVRAFSDRASSGDGGSDTMRS